MYPTDIEDKVTAMLTEATVNNVNTHIIQGIDNVLLDWNQMEQYPRLIVVCDDVRTEGYQVGGACIKSYSINIYVLGYGNNLDDLEVERDIIMERIETELRNNQRLDNLADNSNTERVYSSSIDSIRMSKSGVNESFYSVGWVSLTVNTDRNSTI